jgi:hypothetical protein
MESFAIVTVVTRNYLHFAHALQLSIQEHSPSAQVFVCLADHPGEEFEAPFKCAGWLDASKLGIANWKRFAFGYTPFELSCALKPFAMRELFTRGFERVAYCDSDLQFYRAPVELHQWLDRASLVLTPHAIGPLRDAADLDESMFLRAGVFNAGFLAAKRSEVTERFLDWWSAKLQKQCIDDQQHGLFVDQKWLDLVPTLFPEVHLSRSHAYNAGHWTLMQVDARLNTRQETELGGERLACWHFSGFQAKHPSVLCRWLPQCTVERYPALAGLASRYAQRLIECGNDRYEKTACQFATLNDGTLIKRSWREAIRIDHPALADLEDPFDVTATPNLVERFRSVEESVAGSLDGRLAGQELRDGVNEKRGSRKSWGKELERLVRRVRDQSVAQCARLRNGWQASPASKEITS